MSFYYPLSEETGCLSLLPDYHLGIVGASIIVETVPEGFRALESHRLHPSTLISGPSATDDIEMTRIHWRMGRECWTASL